MPPGSIETARVFHSASGTLYERLPFPRLQLNPEAKQINTNNILRSIATALNFDITQLQAIFALVEIDLTEKEVGDLLETHDEPGFMPCQDYMLIQFLNGLIEHNRGKKTGELVQPIDKTAKILNNDVLKKLRIALNFHEKDVREALSLVKIELTKSDFSGLFRKADHPHYKPCGDEMLISFIKGVGLLLQQQQSDSGP